MNRKNPFEVALRVFAKAPVPGRVKTRLAGALGKKRAAALYDDLLQRTLATAVAANIGPVTLFCTPDSSHPRFEQLAANHSVDLAEQCGADLGARMFGALATGLTTHPGSMVIGTDCPFLNERYLNDAASVLAEGTVPVVIGPAVDGGYVLLGATRLHASLFGGIDWGHSSVLASTRQRLEALGWGWRELAPLHDIDRPEDLALLDSASQP